MVRIGWLAMLLVQVLALAACGGSVGKLNPLAAHGPVAATRDARYAAIDSARGAGNLEEARRLALELAAAAPDDPEALWRASRAESDQVYVQHAADTKTRDAAAGSALEYARRAEAAGSDSVEARAQYAWAMGNATHLQPMFSRSSHARATRKIIDSALLADPRQPTAQATAALLQFRLSTLPFMIKLMAFSAPSSSLEQAELHARAAVEAEPSRLHAMILAKILAARGKPDAAAETLAAALERPAAFPRDAEVEGEMRQLLAKYGTAK